MPEYDFDNVSLQRESNTEAVIRVELDNFTEGNVVNLSFPGGVLKISANVDGKVYSKPINGLTDKHVEVIKTEKLRGFFRVVLKKRQEGFKVSDVFFG